MLAAVNSHECGEYVRHRGNRGGSRRDLETLRAAINHHAKKGFTEELSEFRFPRKGSRVTGGLPAMRPPPWILIAGDTGRKQTVLVAKEEGRPTLTDEATPTSYRALHPDRSTPAPGPGPSRPPHLTPNRVGPLSILSSGIFYRQADRQQRHKEAPNPGTDTTSPAGPYATLGSANQSSHALLNSTASRRSVKKGFRSAVRLAAYRARSRPTLCATRPRPG